MSVSTIGSSNFYNRFHDHISATSTLSSVCFYVVSAVLCELFPHKNIYHMLHIYYILYIYTHNAYTCIYKERPIVSLGYNKALTPNPNVALFIYHLSSSRHNRFFHLRGVENLFAGEGRVCSVGRGRRGLGRGKRDKWQGI